MIDAATERLCLIGHYERQGMNYAEAVGAADAEIIRREIAARLAMQLIDLYRSQRWNKVAA